MSPAAAGDGQIRNLNNSLVSPPGAVRSTIAAVATELNLHNLNFDKWTESGRHLQLAGELQNKIDGSRWVIAATQAGHTGRG
jgi:hypothetical protein